VLARLARSGDSIVRLAVACNPNTLEQTLLTLAIEFPVEVSENPLFSLMLLENPRLTAELSANDLAQLLKQPVIPELFFQSAFENEHHDTYEVWTALIENENTPIRFLEQLGLKLQISSLLQRLFRHPNMTPEQLENFAVQGRFVKKQ
jgi:hypothetical protein